MTEFRNHSDELVIPDDLTIAQFMLDGNHPLRPVRPASAPWLIDDDTGRGIGLEEIRTRVFGLANSLSADYSIRDNDVVCIFSPNHVDFPVAVWAAHRLGAIASCANPGYNAEELVHQLTVSKSSAIIVHPAAIGVAVSAAREAKIPTNRIVLFDADVTNTQKGGFATVSELVHRGLSRPARFVEQRLQKGEAKTKLAFLSFSSGTTGKPKAVGISHYGPIANVLQTAIHWGVGVNPKSDCFAPGDVALCVLPLYHIYGLIVNLHCMLFNAMPVVIVPKFNFSKWLDSIQRFRVSHLLVVPPQVVLLCKSPDTSKADLSSIKYIMSGAAPLTSELQQELTRILPQARIGQGYGMTETATSIALLPWYVKQGAFGCAGRLLPGVTARVVKEDGSLAKVNERGELVVKAPSLALRYTNDAKATAETFVDGWVRTGDEVRIDENNDLYVVDRLKEIIKVRGYQVPPAELEGHLLGHPDVGDVCVVGVPDDYSGEVPMAFVVLSPTAAGRANGNPSEVAEIKASISKYVADHKVKYKHLAGGVEIVESIPKNPSGKLLRRLIRDQARALRAKNAPNKAKL